MGPMWLISQILTICEAAILISMPGRISWNAGRQVFLMDQEKMFTSEALN